MTSCVHDRPDSVLFQEISRELLTNASGFRFRAMGSSMSPTIRDGEVLHVEPVDLEKLRAGDIVLFRDAIGHRAHRIVTLDAREMTCVTQGDSSAEADSPILFEQICGQVIAKQKTNQRSFVSLCGRRAQLRRIARESLISARSLAGRLIPRRVATTVRAAMRRSFPVKTLLLLAFLSVVPSLLFGQIALDTTTSTTQEITTAARTVTLAHTTTGFNLALVVGVSINLVPNTGTTVTSVTYAGYPLTLAVAHNDAGNTRRAEIWYMVAPATGTNNVVVTFNGTGTQGVVVGATTFTGVSQDTPVRATASADGNSRGSSVTVTSAAGDVVMDTLAMGRNRNVNAYGAGQASLWNNTSGFTTNIDIRGVASTDAGVAPTDTVTETLSFTTTWSQVAISLEPFPQLGLDSESSGGADLTNGAPSLTFAHTTTGTSLVMVVGVSMNIQGNTNATVSGVTYNGVALTRAGFHNDAGNTRRVEFWYLIAPATGTHNVVVTLTIPGGTGTIGTVAGATTYTGADQTSPIRSFASADGAAGGTSALDVPSAVYDTVVDAVAIAGNQTVTAFGPTQVGQYQRNSGAATAAPDVYGAGSTRSGAPSVPLSETFNANSNWVEAAVSVRLSQTDLQANATATSAAFPANLTFTAAVTNNGPSPAANVTLTDVLAGSFSSTTVVPTGGLTCGTTTSGPPAQTTVTCTVASLAVNASAGITVTVTPTVAGGYPSTVNVSVGAGSPPDLNNTNNTYAAMAFSQSLTCAVPGNNGATGTLNGVINSYYPGTANVNAGATSIPVGALVPSGNPAIATGDLLLVIQMQDASISSSNNSDYGDNATGGGWTNLNSAGLFEFVKATGPVAGGFVPISGAGPGGGLLYSYHHSAATGTQGQSTYQIIRVPQYASATLGAGLTASAWNGSTGGVAAVDVAGTLNLNGGAANVSGLGFRGAAGMELTGGTGANTDYVAPVPATTYTGTAIAGVDSSKAEGIAGTPRYVNPGVAPYLVDTGVDGYPGGSMARGAPGNAGGGSTDGNPPANDQNAGGGGGGNGGMGGAGGDSWNTNLSTGGVGGSPFPASAQRMVLGGGGGGGTRNNSDGDAQASSGSPGGGMVIIRAGGLTGTGTISANGSDAYIGTANDAGGGGGAGGTVLVLSNGGGEGGLTISAHGGRGGDAWDSQAFSLVNRHGPGGGGGGGVILASGVPGSSNVSGGGNGTTLTPGASYGATSGGNGLIVTNVSAAQEAGSLPGTLCSPDLTIAKSHVGNFTRGLTGNYTLTVSNINAYSATSGLVTVTDTLPPGLTPTAASGTGWSCSIVTQTVTCTRSDSLATSSSYPNITITVSVAQTAPSSVTNTATVSGGGEVITTNDTATDPTTIVSSSDLSITKTAPATVATGATFSYSIVVTAGGPSDSTNVVVTDTLPAGVTYVSATTTVGSCSQAAGTVTCNVGSLAYLSTATITITVTAGAPNKVTNTATVAGTEPDPNLANNTASATTTITFPTSVNLESFHAIAVPAGVLLVWRTGAEQHNLGFNVYRDNNGQKVRLNPALIAGSALIFRGGLPRHGGKRYAWIDRNPSSAGAWYWLEDVDLDGTRTLHGPVAAQTSSSAESNVLAQFPGIASPGFRRSSRVQIAPPSVNVTQSPTMAQMNSIAGSGADTAASHVVAAAPFLQANNRSVQRVQFSLAAMSAIKISVQSEGWYQVTQPQLVAAGLSPYTDPRSLKLYAEGVEQPILITGARNGFGGFGPQAAIQFYGTGIDTPYSDTRVYWLVAGKGAGTRIPQSLAFGSAGPQPQEFEQTVELKQRTTYFSSLLRPNADNFFGAAITSTPTDQVLTVSDLASSAADGARLKVVLQGVTIGASHDVQISLNNSVLGDLQYSGQDEGTISLDIPPGLLQQGANTVTLTSQDGASDISLVDYIDLTYPHTYTAESDSLKFTAPAGDSIQVNGFTQPPTDLVDITNPASPILVSMKVRKQGSGYGLTAQVPWVNGTHTLLAVASDQVAPPSELVANQPSSWHRRQSGAQEVVISPADFSPGLQPLVRLRESQGTSVAVVSIEDIYDEFNFGERSPYAIRDFLQRATEVWRQKPAYLLLVGDASVDPRDYLGLGFFDFVPTALVPTAEMMTASDDWFSDFNNTGFAQIETGRIPARTEAGVQLVVSKIVNYETTADSGSWTKQAVFVADPDDSSGGFTTQAQAVQSLLPSSIRATDIFLGNLDASSAQQELLNSLNNGALFVNFNGHGSVEVWSTDNLMDDSIAGSLTNSSHLPVFFILDCLNGYFQDVYTESLSEALLFSPNGGAVAVWASSGLTSAAPQFQMDQTAVQTLFSSPQETLGDAIKVAKQGITDSDVRRTFLLFGDPLMRLQGNAVEPVSSFPRRHAPR